MALGGTIRGKRTTLRAPNEDDLAAYSRWMADMRVRRLCAPWHQPAMPATWKERLTEQAKDQRGVLWSIEADSHVVGLVRARVGGVESGPNAHLQHFILDPEEWRKGYGWDAALALHRYFFDYLDLKRVGTELRADNAAALRIAERLGYTEFARGHQVHYRDGGYVDEAWIVMERAAWDERFGTSEREYVPFGATR
ncbi:MAG TPA: GNAT family protein [Candidatus Limnocylindria bacterium]|jgi:RimJ/RimL family protein N-acetyltransferase|nr:GNAT family protein [Candidatus Limnocylindria bacterium]